MRINHLIAALAIGTFGTAGTANAQSVKHIQPSTPGGIATAVWVGDTLYVSVADPAMDNKLDFAGMNAAYNKFFGTETQPNKPARSTVQVAALVASGPLLEIEVQAARNR